MKAKHFKKVQDRNLAIYKKLRKNFYSTEEQKAIYNAIEIALDNGAIEEHHACYPDGQYKPLYILEEIIEVLQEGN